jgi:hypothetical protein
MSPTTGSAGRDAAGVTATDDASMAKEINVSDRDEDTTTIAGDSHHTKVIDGEKEADVEKGTQKNVHDETAEDKEEQEREREQDPNVVGWDGPDDPASPSNWPDKDKWLNITVLSILTLVT